jgi:SAM-dependent methyltransferase
MARASRGGARVKGREHWDKRHQEKAGKSPGSPSAFVMDQAAQLAPGALVLDLAAGRGRHALAFARNGLRVVALDWSIEAMAGGRWPMDVHPVVADMRALPLREGAFDAIVCVNFLDRALFPTLHRWLRPLGRLIVETFTVEQLALPHGPRSREHLLEPGELPRLVGPLRVAAVHEGLVRDAAGERYVGAVAAVNPASP